MYSLASQMEGLPVISLQTSDTIAWTGEPIIDITNLEILAFHCETADHKRHVILMMRDIRQLATDCVIIDSEDELTDPEDLIRLHDVIEESYTPTGKSVVSDLDRKLGHVEDYSINLDTQQVQKLYVRGSLLRAWLGANLIIDRAQILDITPKKITVRDSTLTAPIMQTEPIPETPS